MAQSESIAALAGALCEVQGALKGAKKDSLNPHFKSKYADLASVWDACRAALHDHGLAVVQAPEPHDSGILLRTVLMHKSGEWIDSVLLIPAAQLNPQAFGSAMSYARRYALASMVGVVPDDDDDGSSASGRQASPQQRTQPATYTPPSAEQAPSENVQAKLRFLAFASEVVGKPIRSWTDALKVWKTSYDEPQTMDEWRAAASAFRAAVKPTQAGLAAEYDDIEQTERQVSNGAAGVAR